jgi:hypothetical protein
MRFYSLFFSKPWRTTVYNFGNRWRFTAREVMGVAPHAVRRDTSGRLPFAHETLLGPRRVVFTLVAGGWRRT